VRPNTISAHYPYEATSLRSPDAEKSLDFIVGTSLQETERRGRKTDRFAVHLWAIQQIRLGLDHCRQ